MLEEADYFRPQIRQIRRERVFRRAGWGRPFNTRFA